MSEHKNFICGLIATTLSLMHSLLLADSLRIDVMTEATPFTLRQQPVERDGEATLFVKAILDRAGIDYTFSFTPWKRSYRYAQTRDSILIYPIARTTSRASEFVWVGKIIPIKYYLFKLRSRTELQLTDIEQAKALNIGVVNDHVHHEYLLSEGFKNIQPVNSSAQNLRKLLLNRIDLFPISAGGLLPLCAQLNFDCTLLEPALALEDFSDGLYMAYSLNTDPSIVKKTVQAYQELIGSDFYEALFADRLRNASLFEQAWARKSNQQNAITSKQ